MSIKKLIKAIRDNSHDSLTVGPRVQGSCIIGFLILGPGFSGILGRDIPLARSDQG